MYSIILFVNWAAQPGRLDACVAVGQSGGPAPTADRRVARAALSSARDSLQVDVHAAQSARVPVAACTVPSASLVGRAAPFSFSALCAQLALSQH